MYSIETPFSFPHTLQFAGNQFGPDESSPHACGGPYPPAMSIHGAGLSGTWTRELSSDLESLTHRSQSPPFSLSSRTGAPRQQRARHPLAIKQSHRTSFASISHDSSEPYNVGDAPLRPAKIQGLASMADNVMKIVASQDSPYQCSECGKALRTRSALR